MECKLPSAANAAQPDNERIIGIISHLKTEVRQAVKDLIDAGATPGTWGQLSEVCHILDRCYYSGDEPPRLVRHAGEMMAATPFNEMGPYDQIQTLRTQIQEMREQFAEQKAAAAPVEPNHASE